MNPTRLNSVNRMRWLCERTMRADKRMDEIDTKVDEMEGNAGEDTGEPRAHHGAAAQHGLAKARPVSVRVNWAVNYVNT